jgi:crotonobetainyl-CoA:carnitine CoA-transferase CaiB-like acyl-CoA transferase
MVGPLDGIRVLDFTERIQGPYGTQVLADLGADVIKVERRTVITPDGRPDQRYDETAAAAESTPDLYRATFLATNRNKRSVTLDLRTEAGREIARRLVETVDVVYENFRPGVMDRLGLGYEQCRSINPSIVYASASGYGVEGPYAAKPGQDVLVQAISGLGAMNASAQGRPTAVGMSLTDVLGGMNGATAVLAALLHRERTGEGQQVRVDLLSSALAAQCEPAVYFLNSNAGEPARGTVMHAHPYIPPPYGFYATKDGYLALSSGRQIPQLARLLDLPELLEDPRFADYGSRSRNRAEMEELIEGALRQRTTAEWLEVMETEDMFVAPVHGYGDVFSDPQVEQAGLVVSIDSPGGELRLIAPPFELSRTPAGIRTAPPRHGEHTAEVLAEVGYGAERLQGLREEGAI